MYQAAANNRFIVREQLSVVSSVVKSFAAACCRPAPTVWGRVDPQLGKAIFGGQKSSSARVS
jgi:hypothetical protein